MRKHYFERYIYERYYNPDDPLNIILRGHLFIESALSELISACLPRPEALHLDSWRFPQKVDLATACGVLENDEKACYIQLNKLRNRLAHQVEVVLQPSDVDVLMNSMSPRFREIYDGFFSEDWDDVKEPLHFRRLRDVISVMYLVLEGRLNPRRRFARPGKYRLKRDDRLLYVRKEE